MTPHDNHYELRPYQQDAVNAVLAHFRTSGESACLVLPTGAGKSLIIAELCRLAKGRVLVLCHVKELCEQNYGKYTALTGHTAGLYSAGLGRRVAGQRVTFGSVQSVALHLDEFVEPISLLIVDECHRVSLDEDSQYQRVVRHLLGNSPSLRLLGLTATPYRLDVGFCYRRHAWGMVRSDQERPFERCVFEVTLRQLLSDGYLTPPRLLDAPLVHYDYSGLDDREADGPDHERAVNALLGRHRRVTRSIVEQIVELAESQGRVGVMIFAATVEHAREVASYLPQAETGLILGATDPGERDRIVADFGRRKLRYLVNVAVLTTGFDAPHVDFIALLRPTASVGLFQQMVGRGLRLFENKKDCLVIDYAGNGYSLFSPEVGEPKPPGATHIVPVPCPACDFENQFWGRMDEDGHVIEHFGRRCAGYDAAEKKRCGYRFVFKECPHCQSENDIAARSCATCQRTLIDPDDALKDALRLKDARVLRVSGVEFVARGSVLTISYHDEDGSHLSERFDFDHGGQRAVFNRIFARRIAQGRRPLALETATQAAQLAAHLPRPDFVVARARKTKGRAKRFVVQDRVFDYAGRFRKAARAD